MKQGGFRGENGSFNRIISSRQNAGYTIVEVLIVLAVTGLIFISAVLLISGRQNRAEFTTSINDARQQFQQLINETGSGYFPNRGNFTCSSNGVGGVAINASTAGQGTNAGCIFLGKAMQLQTNQSNYNVYPIAGNQAGNKITGLASSGGAQPTPVRPIVVAGQFEYGLTIQKVLYSTDTSIPSIPASGLGFLAGDETGSFGTSLDPNQATLPSGTVQQLTLYAFPVAGGTFPQLLGQANGANYIVATSATVCLQSGTTNQSGRITLGGANSLAAEVQIFDSGDCT